MTPFFRGPTENDCFCVHLNEQRHVSLISSVFMLLCGREAEALDKHGARSQFGFMEQTSPASGIRFTRFLFDKEKTQAATVQSV